MLHLLKLMRTKTSTLCVEEFGFKCFFFFLQSQNFQFLQPQKKKEESKSESLGSV